MAAERLPIAPAGLGRDGRLLWRRLNHEYELSPGQLELLKALCETVDRLADVRAALEGADLVLQGKMGARAHPLLSVERDLRQTQLRIARAIGIHADSEEGAAPYDSARRQLAAVDGHRGRRKVL